VQNGDLVEGVVQAVMPYGVFVGIGAGRTALLHLSQISGDRVVDVDALFAEGDKIKVSKSPGERKECVGGRGCMEGGLGSIGWSPSDANPQGVDRRCGWQSRAGIACTATAMEGGKR
jgi:hypothetical protein